ncbi:substrate-binding domain-containing protein [Vibrio sp. Of7-15]|uniref:substrate-binding domain-containing protein n=1 Tax=Vibrio sp. Of7-15 TaxID=2724879 RepID=UPI001EF39EBC|nr:substrate-binding domain-containing protein [Vibrio sp. Of7-15]MCG7499627.1 substrate-binding domain-containing protein [Vibrio sp. Of7-15]
MAPWIVEPGTQVMVETFKNKADNKGWKTEVITEQHDFLNILKNKEKSKTLPDAIVINLDPNTIPEVLDLTEKLNIPVFGMDSLSSPHLVSNVMSNSYTMAAESATYLVDQLSGKGRVVTIEFGLYPPVQKRGVIAKAIFDNAPGIQLAGTITPNVGNNAFISTKQQVSELLRQTKPGEISAIWAAWDQPALAAVEAIKEANRVGDGILVVGIDGTKKALAQIENGSGLNATVVQNFNGIIEKVINQIEHNWSGHKNEQSNFYIPSLLVTQS